MFLGAVDHPRVFIRRTQTRRAKDGSVYSTCRLVRSERRGGKVRQRTLLNLGRHFEIEPESWPRLCARIEDLLDGQPGLLDDVPAAIETEAQRIAALLLARGLGEAPGAGRDAVAIHPDSMELARPRSVGVEQVGLWAMEQVGLMPLLEELGVNGALRAAAAGLIVGRLAHPASERETHRWLGRDSGLGELLGVDYEAMGAMQLYRASDALVKHRDVIEARLFERAMDLFGLSATVTLFDLTNTYFEGDAGQQSLARHGHSKEKRSDCPLLTLGLVLDGSGFVSRSRVFAGNVREHTTLQGMLEGLGAPADALVVMDRGIATEAQIAWLRESGYRYLVVSRKRKREFDAEAAEPLATASGHTLHLDRRVCEDTAEVRLNCYSEERAQKERAMVERLCARYEAALTKLAEGLSKPRARRKPEQVHERIGRLKAKHRRVAGYYKLDLTVEGDRVESVAFTREPAKGSMADLPGVYCLRTNLMDWDAERLWKTYVTLTDLEAVFRCLKSELGLRPIHHRVPRRTEGHLFIAVLAYQLVQIVRRRLRENGHTESWTALRNRLAPRCRVTATFRCADGRTLHLRKATALEPHQQPIYDILGIHPDAGGFVKKVI